MKSKLKTGVCVSCGREPGRRYRNCPYCGEEVWHAPAWRAASAAVLASVVGALGFLIVLTHPSGRALTGLLHALPPAAGYLLALGLGLAFLPCDDAEIVATSQRELCRWQGAQVAGALLVCAVAAGAAACLRVAQTPPGLAAWTLGATVCAGAAASPFFFFVPWRGVLAAVLLVAALALG